MSSVASLRLRVERMTAAIQQQNAPRIIDCTGARDALIAKLQMYRDTHAEEQAATPALTEEEMRVKVQAFKVMLAQMVQDRERASGVKFVSRESEL